MGVTSGGIILMVCACMFGFFCSAYSVAIEVGCIITGTRFFTFAYGYMQLMMAVGWVVGPPTAGYMFVVKPFMMLYGSQQPLAYLFYKMVTILSHCVIQRSPFPSPFVHPLTRKVSRSQGSKSTLEITQIC